MLICEMAILEVPEEEISIMFFIDFDMTAHSKQWEVGAYANIEYTQHASSTTVHPVGQVES